MVLLIWRFIPMTPVFGHCKQFDFVGAIGLGIGLLCLLIALTKGTDWGWTSPTVLIPIAVAVIALTSWSWWELRFTDPLVNLRVTTRPVALMTNIAGILVGFALYSQSLVLPQLLRLPTESGFGLGQSMLAMGLLLVPSGLTMIAVSTLGGRLSNRYGPKFTLVSGCIVSAAGYGSSMFLFGSTWGVFSCRRTV